MKQIIDKEKVESAEILRKYISFGQNCSLCLPYVNLIFTTGKTEFEPMPMTGDYNE